MPTIWMPQAEYDALRSMLTAAARIDWAAYDRARAYLLNPLVEDTAVNRLQLADDEKEEQV